MAEETLRRKADEQIKEIHERLYQGEKRMETIESRVTAIEGDVTGIKGDLSENTELTRKIWENISGIVAFSDDLASGSRLLCRAAKGITFAIDKIIKPFWIPVTSGYLAIYFVRHDHTLPDWAYKLIASVVGP